REKRTVIAMQLSVLCLLLVAASALAMSEVSRPKRSTYIVYYMCNNNGRRFVSNYPCSYNYANYGYNNIPQAFYDPYNNCNSGCYNLACNQYNGQYFNGQYVAYSTVNSQYSPCASTCCAYNNGNYNIGNGASPIYPLQPVNNNNIGNGASPDSALVSRSKRQYNSCRSGESSIGPCVNGRCPYNLMCSSANQCCLCGDGVSAGPCAGGCPSGYLCASSGQCCRGSYDPPTTTLPPITTSTNTPGGGLQQCGWNRSCPNGYTCGDGNVCFPWIIG
ncbi:hypothetical protein PMAYCL1PPCAC_27120, partial [Pristionchus mayeri]